MDRSLLKKVRELYQSGDGWSRNRYFRSHGADGFMDCAMRRARHLSALSRAMNGCSGNGGVFEAKRGGGRVALKFRYENIAAVWTSYLTEEEFEMIIAGKEGGPGCRVC
jgi:hypothetical protein